MRELLPAPAQSYATVLVWFHTLQPCLPSWRGRWMCCLFRSRHTLPGLVGNCLKHEATSRVHNTHHLLHHTHTQMHLLSPSCSNTYTHTITHLLAAWQDRQHTLEQGETHIHTRPHIHAVCQRSLYLGWDSRQCESTHTGTLRWAGRSVLSPSL